MLLPKWPIVVNIVLTLFIVFPVEKPSNDESKKSGEEVQGRFFLKDKLCSLGLADVRYKLYKKIV